MVAVWCLGDDGGSKYGLAWPYLGHTGDVRAAVRQWPGGAAGRSQLQGPYEWRAQWTALEDSLGISELQQWYAVEARQKEDSWGGLCMWWAAWGSGGGCSVGVVLAAVEACV